MKYTSPTSVMASMKRRLLVAGSKRLRWFRASATCAMATPIGSAIWLASGVGCMPLAVRTNSSSPKLRRSRASALLTADCDSPRRRAADEIWRSLYTSWNTESRFRSISCASIMDFPGCRLGRRFDTHCPRPGGRPNSNIYRMNSLHFSIHLVKQGGLF